MAAKSLKLEKVIIAMSAGYRLVIHPAGSCDLEKYDSVFGWTLQNDVEAPDLPAILSQVAGLTQGAHEKLADESEQPQIDPDRHVCDNCDWQGMTEELDPISDYFERVKGGMIAPSGQCPECGALCYPLNAGK
jgi:hypothetical protein